MMPLAARARSVAHAPRGSAASDWSAAAMARSRATGPWALSSSMSPRARTPRWWLRLGGGDEQGLGRRGGVVEAVGGAVLAGEAFARARALRCATGSSICWPRSKERRWVARTAPASRMRTVFERGRDDEGASRRNDEGWNSRLRRIVCRVSCPPATSTRSSQGKGLSGSSRRWARSSAKTSATVRWGSSGQGRSAARVLHHSSAWSLRSSRSRNRRALKKLWLGKPDDVAPLDPSHFRERARQGAVRSGSEQPVPAAWDGIGWRRHGVRARRFSCCR